VKAENRCDECGGIQKVHKHYCTEYAAQQNEILKAEIEALKAKFEKLQNYTADLQLDRDQYKQKYESAIETNQKLAFDITLFKSTNKTLEAKLKKIKAALE
jgi:FtsZ-binding cell division protein ZapB